MSLRRLRLCYVVSSEMTAAAFLKDHMAAALLAGYQISLVANASDRTFLDRLGLAGVTFYRIDLRRQVSPWKDWQALLGLIRLFRTQQFDIVHSVSPKAGMLAMLAARISGVPNRIHTFTGQVWVTRRGMKRGLLKQMDRLLAGLTTISLVDSPSQRAFLLSEEIIDSAKAEVIGKGAICGVDGDRFRPDPVARKEIRMSLCIPEDAPLLLFLGRQNRDKGLLDLAEAFVELGRCFPKVYLLLVGPDEQGLSGQIDRIGGSLVDRIRHVEFTGEPERYMAAADVFCLPSYREGFGMVAIEAAAAGLPIVASRIYGLTDAVDDGVTGLFHAPGNVAEIESAIGQLIRDEPLRLAMGERGRERALRDFSRLALTEGLLAFYERIVALCR